MLESQEAPHLISQVEFVAIIVAISSLYKHVASLFCWFSCTTSSGKQLHHSVQMPSGVRPLEGFHSHNHLLCMSNIPSQAATLLPDQNTAGSNFFMQQNQVYSTKQCSDKSKKYAYSKLYQQAKPTSSAQKLERNNEYPCNTIQIHSCNSSFTMPLLHSLLPLPECSCIQNTQLQTHYSCQYTGVNKISPACRGFWLIYVHKCATYTQLCVSEYKHMHKHICNQLSCNIAKLGLLSCPCFISL